MFEKWRKAWAVYFDRRQLIMTGMGFSSGFPFLLVASTLSLWLTEAEVSLKTIGIFSLVRVPYSFKWLWSPFVDRISLPFFGRLGRRRGWAIFSQLLLMAALAAMAAVNPKEQTGLLMLFALFTAFASATQDIVLDAYRVESFAIKEQGAASAVFMIGYRLGTIFSGAGALVLATFMSWPLVYLLMAAGTLIGMITVLAAPEPREVELAVPLAGNTRWEKLKAFLVRAVKMPLADFITRPHWVMILLLVMLYKLCDAYMAPMAMPFYSDMGFSKLEIASVTKIYGIVATIAGSLFGGVLVSRYGLYKSLIIGSAAMGLTTLMFSVQSFYGNNIYLLMATISLDNLAGGMSTTALVAYISAQCHAAFTATQYALLSSFMGLLRDALAATSGLVVQAAGWASFFVFSTLLAVPGLILVIALARLETKPYTAAENK